MSWSVRSLGMGLAFVFVFLGPGADRGKLQADGIRSSGPPIVDAFHAAAVKAGGKDNGAPGPRPHYGPAYYGAFVIDPAGNNAEVVCHDAPAN
ncbi:hypothetical protein MCOR23_004160 [Pyricularia oryzae]|nr:hypothetical protein MCOR23_004160 [Pyricularia oryzae]